LIPPRLSGEVSGHFAGGLKSVQTSGDVRGDVSDSRSGGGEVFGHATGPEMQAPEKICPEM
jgi:hypothetical protein